MQDQKHYFDALGLKPGAPPEEIINAYKTLMEYWNPDRVPDFYKQKAMEGRDKIEEAYQEIMGLRKVDHQQIHKQVLKPKEQMKLGQSITDADAERAFLGKDRDGAPFYLDTKSIVFNRDKVEIAVDIYPPAGSTRFHTAQGYVRRAGFESLECLVERWGLGFSNKVFIKYGLSYKSKCGHIIEAALDNRKVWKPIAPGTLEEIAWKVVDGMLHKEKVA
jgi:curved DNA-binding protein CbpA